MQKANNLHIENFSKIFYNIEFFATVVIFLKNFPQEKFETIESRKIIYKTLSFSHAI